jgi:hypothetical protein
MSDIDPHIQRHMLADIMIGGNHLASSLVHTLGADFSERYPATANPATMRDAICNRVNGMIGTSAAWIVIYDIWVAWSAIMRLSMAHRDRGEEAAPVRYTTSTEQSSADDDSTLAQNQPDTSSSDGAEA